MFYDWKILRTDFFTLTASHTFAGFSETLGKSVIVFALGFPVPFPSTVFSIVIYADALSLPFGIIQNFMVG